MRFLDLFSGIGGFRMGLEMAGHECVGHVEIDKYANQSYRAIHKPKEREFFHEDITTITDESIRELRDRGIDIIAGGFPCQAFSIAGKRAGFEDTRGTLFFDIARIAKEIKPKYLFLENVKGLLNHDRGDTFEVILRSLDEIGYDAEWQVLNSKHFGVPQNRERVFIIGHLRGGSTRKVFPIGSEYEEIDGLQGQHIGTITTRTGVNGTVGTYIVEGEQLSQKINQIGNLIDTDSFGGNPQTGRVYGTDGISPCLSTMQGGGLEPKIAIPVLTPDRAEKRQNGRRFKENGEPMFTLTAQDRHGVAVGGIYTQSSEKFQCGILNGASRTIKASQHDAAVVLKSDNDFRIRKLTPKECWRLQGVPDEYFYKAAYGNEIPVDLVQKLDKRTMNREEYKQYSMLTRKRLTSDSQLYKQAGNACTVNVMYEIAKRIGFEIDEDYYNAAQKRIAENKAQVRMIL